MSAQKIQRLKRFISEPRLRNTHRMMRVVSGVSRFRILRLLKAYGGSLNVTEIADTLEVPVSTVKTRLYRGLVQMRERLERQGVRRPAPAPAPLS